MDTVAAKLTVFFEDPFYVGLYERECGGAYEACKITFGAAPKDGEVYAFLLESRRKLRFSPATGAAGLGQKAMNPKRMQRAIQKQLQAPAISTKAQQALKLQRAQNGQARKARSRAQRAQEAERGFALRQQKRREKHKGH